MPLAGLRPAAALLMVASAAAPFPHVDIVKLCAGVSVFGAKDKAGEVCRREEAEARSELGTLWLKLGSDDRSTCLGDAELGVARSYVDILGCVKTALELKREKALPPDRRIPPQ